MQRPPCPPVSGLRRLALAIVLLTLACAGDPEAPASDGGPTHPPVSCGDGVLDAGQGEECDDGNTASGDGCSAACLIESCGDGVLDTGMGEQCDDGNVVSGDGCSATCVADVVTIVGGSGEDSFRDVAIGPDGFVYVVGGTASADFPVTPGAWDTSFDGRADAGASGPHDVIVARFTEDGVLDWATFVGGVGYDRAYAVEVDATGVYVAGRAARDFPTTTGALQTAFQGDSSPNGFYGPQDGFVLKLSLDGTQLLWSTYVGDPGPAFVRDIAIDAAGDVYVAMTQVRTASPHVTLGAYDTTKPGPNGNGDSVILKLVANGTRRAWGTWLGGAEDEDLVNPAIRVNASKEVFVTGQTFSDDYPILNAFQPSLRGSSDMAVTGLTANGSALIFSTYLGGTGDEETETHSLALGPASSVVVAATTTSGDLPGVAGAFQSSYGGGGADGFVTILTRDGTLVGSTYLGGGNDDELEGVAVHGSGAVLVSGISRSNDFPVTTARLQASRAGDFDQIVAVFDSGLTSLVYGTWVGGVDTDSGRAAAIAADGSLVVAGHANSGDFPTTDGTVHSAPGAGFGGRDATVVGVRP
jgi:cysteine-rich repeat protein